MVRQPTKIRLVLKPTKEMSAEMSNEAKKQEPSAPPQSAKEKPSKTKLKKNSLVLREEGVNFEHVEKPLGHRWYYEVHYWVDFLGVFDHKEPVYLMAERGGNLEEWVPSDEINYLPSKLYRAHKGCDSYSRLLAYKASLLEKIKVVLLAGLVLAIIFFTFLIISG